MTTPPELRNRAIALLLNAIASAFVLLAVVLVGVMLATMEQLWMLIPMMAPVAVPVGVSWWLATRWTPGGSRILAVILPIALIVLAVPVILPTLYFALTLAFARS